MNRPARRQRVRIIDFPREAIADDAELPDIAARSTLGGAGDGK
jgi:hypothetical protein